MKPAKLKLLIFDMDGTITVPNLDFRAIKADMGVPPGELILEHLAGLSIRERRSKESILHQHEETASLDSVLQPGAAHALQRLEDAGFHLALLTRNSRRSVDIIMRKHDLSFQHIYTRDNAPPKPDPGPILELMKQLNVTTEQTVMIGDFWMDVITGTAAGVRTILLNKDPDIQKKEGADPTARVTTYKELLQVLEEWNES